MLGLLYPRRLRKTHHVAGGGCRNRACQVRSWSSEEAGLAGPGDRWEIGPWLLIYPRRLRKTYHVAGAGCRNRACQVRSWSFELRGGWISMGPSVVGRDWSPVSSNKARGYCCRTSCRPSSPIAAGACSPAVFACAWCIAGRLPKARGRAGAGAAGASYVSSRSGAMQLPL
jgi:hypothetical protein